MTRRSRLLFIFSLLVVTLAAYWPALHGDFIWDDDRHVSNNHTLLNLTGLEHIWFAPRYLPQWYPLTHTTFWIEWRFFGLNTFGYHLDNVLLHVCDGVLLYWLLQLLKIRGAMLAAVIFALHPIEVESVAWISERKNVLSTGLALLSLIAYWRATSWKGFFGSFLLFTGAMLSKTVACSTPAVLLLLIGWKRGGVSRNDCLRLIPFFMVAIGLAIFTAVTERDYVGARGPDWNISFVDRCLIASHAVWFYVGKLLFPIHLTFNYPRWSVDSKNGWLYLYPVSLLLLVMMLWLLRKRIGLGPLIAVAIFVGVLFPALGFINTYPMRYSFVADHFQYAAGIALIVLVSSAVCRWVPQSFLVLIIGAPLGVLTFRHTHAYSGPEALWRDTIAKNPSSWLAMENLGVLESLDNRSAEALPLFAEVAAIKPDNDHVHANWGDALSNLGRWNEAIAQYHLAMASPTVDESVVHDRIGVAMENLNRSDDAIAEFRIAIASRSTNVTAMFHLADTLAARGDLIGALSQSDQVLRLMPDATDALHATADWLLKLHRPAEAEGRLRHLLTIDPADVASRLTLANLELQLNQPDAAARDFSAVIQLEPNNAAARKGLVEALARQYRPTSVPATQSM